MYCYNCGTDIPDDRDTCPACGTDAVQKRGLLSRFLGWLRPTRTETTTHVTTHEFHRVQHADSLEDLPPEVRENIEELMATGQTGSVSQSFSYRGPDGVEREYSSLAEMPEDIRKAFEEAHRRASEG